MDTDREFEHMMMSVRNSERNTNGEIMDDRNYTDLYATLQKETTILTAQIRALYRELDRKFHLRGAQIPITFGFETDTLGSYTRAGHHEKEHFHFSLLFVGYGVKNPLTKEDRMDLYRHEYAHYMEIEERNRWSRKYRKYR